MSDDYVSRDYLLGEYDRQHQGPPGGARKIIAEAPAADVVEVRHGRWEHLNWGFEYDRCSVCGYEHRYAEQFACCPSCGAKMDGGQDEAPAGPYDLLYEEGGANTT